MQHAISLMLASDPVEGAVEHAEVMELTFVAPVIVHVGDLERPHPSICVWRPSPSREWRGVGVLCFRVIFVDMLTDYAEGM